MADFKLEDYSKERSADLQRAAVKALTKVGSIVESSAKTKARWDVGDLRDSIDYKVVPKGLETLVHVGSNLNTFPFHEFGTGTHAENGQGRKGYWVYVKGEGGGSSNKSKPGKTYSLQEAKQIMAMLRSKGLEAYYTNGIEAQPMIRPAFRENLSNIKGVISSTFRNEFR